MVPLVIGGLALNFSGPAIKRSVFEIGKDIVLILGGLVLALALVEVALRFYNPLGFRIKGNEIVLPVNRTQVVHNKKGGKLDELVINKKNSLGFRGEVLPEDFHSRLSIITVGGSTTECLALNEEKSWPQLLFRRLQNSFPKVWLNNAGLGGHSTFGHIVLMKDFIIHLKPKVVLFLVGINDVGRSDLVEKEHFRSLGKNLEKLLVAGAAHSEVASALLNLYRFYFPASIPLREVGELDFRSSGTKEIPPNKEEAILAKDRQTYLQPYRERMETLVSLSQGHHIDPVLITQPVLYGTGVDEVTGVHLDELDVYSSTNGRTGWRELELYNEVTRQVGKEHGILVIDLARELPKSSRYYYDWGHYSNAGAEKVAEIIDSQLAPYLAKKFPEYYRGTSLAYH